MKTLEFLIPSYKRPDLLPTTVHSVAGQIRDNNLGDRVRITVTDDCSPNVDVTRLTTIFSDYEKFISCTQNETNKGMSLNIRDMVASSRADFCCILTDDDQLQPGALTKIIQTIDALEDRYGSPLIGSLYVPRYSYLEDGSLYCVECNSFDKNTLIEPSPLHSLTLMHDGFILTGMFFNPRLINFRLWDQHIQNAFFPTLYFSDLLSNYRCLFVDDNWFIHTVLNECHWDAWGLTEKTRNIRLFRDYMEAVSIVANKAIASTPPGRGRLNLLRAEINQYKQEIVALAPYIGTRVSVYSITRCRLAYWIARCELTECYRLLAAIVKRTGRPFVHLITYVCPKCP